MCPPSRFIIDAMCLCNRIQLARQKILQFEVGSWKHAYHKTRTAIFPQDNGLCTECKQWMKNAMTLRQNDSHGQKDVFKYVQYDPSTLQPENLTNQSLLQSTADNHEKTYFGVSTVIYSFVDWKSFRIYCRHVKIAIFNSVLPYHVTGNVFSLLKKVLHWIVSFKQWLLSYEAVSVRQIYCKESTTKLK